MTVLGLCNTCSLLYLTKILKGVKVHKEQLAFQ